MSELNPVRKRFVRVSNPVTPTVHSFSEHPTTPGRMTRVINAVTPTVHTFAAVPELILTIRRHPESERMRLAVQAALLLRKVDELDRSLGGAGMAFDPTGTVEEPTRLTLRMVAKSSDAEAAGRLQHLTAELNRLAADARRELAEQQGEDLVRQIDQLQDEANWAMMKEKQAERELFAQLIAV
jgi:hypothetical protein